MILKKIYRKVWLVRLLIIIYWLILSRKRWKIVISNKKGKRIKKILLFIIEVWYRVDRNLGNKDGEKKRKNKFRL